MSSLHSLIINLNYTYEKLMLAAEHTTQPRLLSSKMTLDVVLSMADQVLPSALLNQLYQVAELTRVCAQTIMQVLVDTLSVACLVEEINSNLLQLLKILGRELDSRVDQSNYQLCICNAHGVIMASDDPQLTGKNFFSQIEVLLSGSEVLLDQVDDAQIDYYILDLYAVRTVLNSMRMVDFMYSCRQQPEMYFKRMRTLASKADFQFTRGNIEFAYYARLPEGKNKQFILLQTYQVEFSECQLLMHYIESPIFSERMRQF